MTHVEHHSVAMDDPRSPTDLRLVYEDAFNRALGQALRYLDREPAGEIAHHVASEMVTLAPGRVTPALIHVAVISRLRDMWRATGRRTVAEGEYGALRPDVAAAWAQPDAELETDELHRVLLAEVRAMPPVMRQVFLLVREHELSYREVAATLGIGAGTVHTHLSRANALLRDCLARYQGSPPSPRRRSP